MPGLTIAAPVVIHVCAVFLFAGKRLQTPYALHALLHLPHFVQDIPFLQIPLPLAPPQGHCSVALDSAC